MSLPRIAGRAALFWIGFFAAACSAQPGDTRQTIEATIRGGGRDITARFDFSCRATSDEAGPVDVPESNSLLYVAPDREALLLTSVQPYDSSACLDPNAARDGREPLTPVFVWFDDIQNPSRVDEIGVGTPGSHRRFNFPELVAFSHRVSPDAPPAPSGGATLIRLREHLPALYVSSSPGRPRLIAAARRVARIEFRDDGEKLAFRELLGADVAPGVRSLDLCALATLTQAREYLQREAPRLIAACPRGTPSPIRANILFGMPLPMKLEGDGRWLAGGADSVASYVKDESSEVEQVASNPGRTMGRASAFWRANVARVTWITLGRRRVELPVRGPSAFYIEEDESFVLFLDDSEILYLGNPLRWTRL